MKINKIKQKKLADGTIVYFCEANKKNTIGWHTRMLVEHIANQLSKEINNK